VGLNFSKVRNFGKVDSILKWRKMINVPASDNTIFSFNEAYIPANRGNR